MTRRAGCDPGSRLAIALFVVRDLESEPGETSCLSLAWAVMDLVIAGGRGPGLTLAEHHAIAALVAARALPLVEQQVA